MGGNLLDQRLRYPWAQRQLDIERLWKVAAYSMRCYLEDAPS
jgi:hypothetical protein